MSSAPADRFPSSFRTRALLDFFRHLKQHYDCFPLFEWTEGRKGIILRQDVDLDLAQARRFADLQTQAGLRSTFYVLLTSSCYNALSAESVRILRSLAKDGFEVGLHYDPTVDDDDRRHLREAELLGRLCGTAVRSISLHNPTSRGEFPLYDGFLNAYDPRIFSPDRYLSDSRQYWRHDPWEFVEKAAEETLQLLFHPCHYSATGHGYEDAFGCYLDTHLRLVDEAFRPFNSRYATVIEPSLRAWYLSPAATSARGRTKTEDQE